ncbi:hypothetical protein JMJ77_0002560 [Colletotrichum scovillei]|uniref:Uncharacterized protein n=1 Tax=Colletotrichum scovillei TaxID=1209932 RepID=A0A9P7UDF9_9PEZI|nr:hypothetical protein JMJ77_0002560 [Colletotrichum scovillei]KAG7070983.1 hypothetical protein JMJ76_0002223 [Colletotrichum scovillei]KAG7079227.1 hypothetical protein JMJ78_0002883 [Colletotrichum scovillei]
MDTNDVEIFGAVAGHCPIFSRSSADDLWNSANSMRGWIGRHSATSSAPFLVALGPVIFARNAEADRGTAAAQAHGQLGGCSTIGGGSSPPPLDDLDPSPKAEVNGEPTAKLVSVPRAKVSGESSPRRNVCILGDDEFLSLRRQKTKILRGASGTNTQRNGQSCCTLGPGSRCSPTAIPIGEYLPTVPECQSLVVSRGQMDCSHLGGTITSDHTYSHSSQSTV